MPDNLIDLAHYELKVFERLGRQTGIRLLELLEEIKKEALQNENGSKKECRESLSRILSLIYLTHFEE